MQFLMILPFFLLIHFAAKLPPVWPGRPQLWPGRNCESVNKNPVELNLCIVQTNSDLQGSCLSWMWWLEDNTTTSTSSDLTSSLQPSLPITAPSPRWGHQVAWSAYVRSGGCIVWWVVRWCVVCGEVFEGSEPLCAGHQAECWLLLEWWRDSSAD